MINSLAKCTTRQTDYKGWEGCTLENGLIRLVTVPAMGGRIMAYDLGPYPYLSVYQAMAGKNHSGETTGIALQLQHTDQSDSSLNSARYTIKSMGSNGAQANILMVGPSDPHSALQISREIVIKQGSSRAYLTITCTNITTSPMQWHIGDAIQLQAGSQDTSSELAAAPPYVITIPLSPNNKLKKRDAVAHEDSPQWNVDTNNALIMVSPPWQKGNVDIDPEISWIGFNNSGDGYSMVGHCTTDPDSMYHNDGVIALISTDDSANNMLQVDLQSPVYTVLPGETVSFDVIWSGCRCNGPILEVNAAGCLTQKFSSQQTEGFYKLSAGGGIFDEGRMFLQWLSKDGEIIQQEKLMDVSPLNTFFLDAVYYPTVHAFSASLTIETISGQSLLFAQTPLV